MYLPETSVSNYQPTMCKDREEWRPQLHPDGSLKFTTEDNTKHVISIEKFTVSWCYRGWYVQQSASSSAVTSVHTSWCKSKFLTSFLLLLFRRFCWLLQRSKEGMREIVWADCQSFDMYKCTKIVAQSSSFMSPHKVTDPCTVVQWGLRLII